MYAELMEDYFDGSQRPFLEFNYRLLSALEQAKIWVTTDDLLSVVKSRKSLLKFVDTLEPSESKSILTNILECEPHHYSSMVSSLIPFLESVGPNIATIFMYLEDDKPPFEDKMILQISMPFKNADIGGYAVAIQLNDCEAGYWYFLNPDPSGTIWGHGWDEAKTLSECFTIFPDLDSASLGLESLKSTRQGRVMDSAIFEFKECANGYIELRMMAYKA